MAESSNHFKRHELECHGNKFCCHKTCFVHKKLLSVLDRFRDHVGGEVSLSRAFTCIKYNCTPSNEGGIGSRPTSRHCKGEAADIQTPKGWTVDRMADWLMDQSEVGAVGRYSWGCHVDIRPRVNGIITRWDQRTWRKNRESKNDN